MATATAAAGSPCPDDPQTLPRPPAADPSPSPQTLPWPRPPVDPLEGHRLHLRALIRQERSAAYRRVDYLSREWQRGLRREEVAGAPQAEDPRESRSPSSVASPALPFGRGLRGGGGADGRHGGLCVRWREKIVEWKYRVVDRCGVDREIVSISTFYLDRYLATKYVDKEQFQLAAMASLYLATKIHSSRKFSLRAIVGTGNGPIHAGHIEATELRIMEALDWRLMPPTAADFLENFHPLLAGRCGAAGGPASGRGATIGEGRASGRGLRAKLDESLEFGRFLCELSVCAYPFVAAAPSSVALAAVLCGLERAGLIGEAGEHCVGLAEGLGLDAEGEEVRACGELLRKVHRLAFS